MTGSLELFRTGFARIGDWIVPPLLLWLGWQVFFGGSQPFQIEAWWVGLAAALTCIAMPGASRQVPIAMLGYIALALISAAASRWTVVNRSPDLAWWELFRPASHLLVMIVFTVGMAHTLRSPKRLALFTATFAAAILLLAAQLLFDRIRTGYIYNEGGSSSMPTVSQWSGIHQLGVVFVAGAPMVMALMVTGRAWSSAVSAMLLTAVIMLAAFLNGSRSGIFSIAIAAVLMLAVSLLSGRPASRRVRTLQAAVMLTIPFAVWYGFTHSSTSMRSLGSLTAGRMPIWTTAVRIAADHPWLGVGPGNYLGALADGGYGQRFLPQWGAYGFTPNHAHNQFLQVAAETGIPSLICFLLMCGWMLRGCWIAMPLTRVRIVALGVMFALAGVLVRANYDSIMDGIIGSDRIRLLVWMLFAMAMAIRGIARTERPS